MLTRIVLKILFKACLPLVAVVGIMSYMMYLQGGDPGAVFSKITASIAGNARQSVKDAGQSMSSMKPASTSSSISEVHKWVDEYGVTHYGGRAPVNAQSTTLRINSNANVVASTKLRAPAAKAEADVVDEAKAQGSQGSLSVKGMTVPGSGGLKMPVNLNRKELTQFLEDAQRPTYERYAED